MTDRLTSQSRPFWPNLAALSVMLVFLAQLTFGSLSLSMTADEPPAIANGYVLLTTGDTWGVPDNGPPPLITVSFTWPLLLQPERPDPDTVRSWRTDKQSDLTRALWPRLGPIDRLAFVTRFPIMLLAVVLMALVYRWACDWFGHGGGLLAIGVMAWDPTLIAHSQLSTTDLGVTLTGFACLYLVNRLIHRPHKTWRLVAGIGVTLGATMGAKSSGTFLVPVVMAMMAWGCLHETRLEWRGLLRTPGGPPQRRVLLRAGGRWLGYTVIILTLGVLILWSAYGFEWRALPGMSHSLPLATHIRMMQTVLQDKNRLAFLWGQRGQGWWWYFPFAFAIKTPIPLIITLIVASIRAARGGWQRWKAEIVLWFFPVTYMAIAITSGLNLGYRLLLPVFPFVYVSIGRLAHKFAQVQSRWQWFARSSAIALGVWYVVGTLQVFPFALAYFNELVGGPRQGYRYLVDSNVDWGQSFKALKTYMDAASIDKVRLSYFTYVDPAVYGVRHEPLYPAPETVPALYGRFDPAPGIYAISATMLQGVMPFPDLYDWFRHQEPIAQPGYGLLVYRVTPRESRGQWIAQCTTPEAPLNQPIIEEGFDRTDLREIRFDCITSWIYPEGGRSPGWYGLHRDAWLSKDSFLDKHLAPTRLVYQQTWYYDEAPFALFQWNGIQSLSSFWTSTQVNLVSSDGSPSRAQASPARTAPIQLNGPLTFLGYRLSSTSNKQSELETAWRAEAVPTRPLAITTQLVGADGSPIASSEGLGVPIDQWQAGDILLQRYRFEIPPSTLNGIYWLQASVHWQDTGERWQVQDTDSDQLILTSVGAK